MRQRQQSMFSCSSSSKIFLFGFILGCSFFLLTRFAIVPCFLSVDRTVPAGDESRNEDASSTPASTTDENLVLIGVMSAKQFLECRVIPSFDTWATSIPGKVSCPVFVYVIEVSSVLYAMHILYRSCSLK